MRIKTWITVVAVFAGVCVAADLATTRGYILRSPFSDSDRIQHLYEDNSDAIPIFGTSKAHGNYCPADMGMNAFNFGMNGVSYEVTDVFLQIELAKSRTTPIIIELQYQDTGVLGSQDRFIPFVSDARFRQLLRRFNAMEWRYYIPGLRYFGYYDSILKDWLSARMHVTKMNNGFSELTRLPAFDQAKLDGYVRDRLKLTTGYYPDEDQNSRLIAQIAGHPQRLFFLVISPYHPSYYAHFQNADKLAAFEAKLSALPNVVLVDWGRLDYPQDDFLDTLHLRRVAAAKFSRQLGEKVRQVLKERSERASAEKAAAKQ